MHYAVVNKNYMADVSCLLGIFPIIFDANGAMSQGTVNILQNSP